MKTLQRACAVAVVIALFHGATVGWSFGVALSSLLTSTALVLACDGIAGAPRIEMIVILTWLYWGLSYVSNLIEALYFRVIPILDAEKSVVGGLVIALLAACILVSLSPVRSQEQLRPVRSAAHLWWRIPLLALLFFLVYLGAGIAINPWIKSFYQNRPLPSLEQLAALQFCRGLLDIACIFPLFCADGLTHANERRGFRFACLRFYVVGARYCYQTVSCLLPSDSRTVLRWVHPALPSA